MESQHQITFHEKHEDLKKSLANISKNRHPIALFCDHLTDPANLGILFRLADAARLQEIIFYNEPDFEITAKINRISRQTVQYVPYRIFSKFEALEKLKKDYEVIALEYTNTSMPINDFESNRPILLVLGNEQRGVSPELLSFSDKSIHLPMYGINSSMNVSMAAGIACYQLIMKN